MSTKGQHQLLVESLSEWIEQNLDKRIVIDDIAERAGYSKWYLQRLFKEVTGDNLASYVRHRRLMRAAAELKRTDKKLWISRYSMVLTVSKLSPAHSKGASVLLQAYSDKPHRHRPTARPCYPLPTVLTKDGQEGNDIIFSLNPAVSHQPAIHDI